MDAAGLSALLTPAGWALLESLPPYRSGDALGLAERLRAEGVDGSLVAAALTQARLRARAEAKFGPFAAGMLFTPEGLEQATRLPVAARHAARFAATGCRRVADLGCGIGGDAMALAGLDLAVLAVERDEATAAVAAVNLRHWPDAVVRHADVADLVESADDVSGTVGTAPALAAAAGPDGAGRVDGAWLDPSRRTAAGRRVLDPRRASPGWDQVLAVAAAVPATGAKVAPGVPRDLAPPGAETQWTSVDGDVVEAAVWFGPLARPGVRTSAVVLRSPRGQDGGQHGGQPVAVVVDDRDVPATAALPVVDGTGSLDAALGAYLYDPDGAVVRSGLVAAVVAATDGRLLDRTIAYVTSPTLVRTPLARAFAVEAVLPFGLKALRTHLRDRGVGRVELLKRGSAVDVEQLRRQLRLTGGAAATVVLTRVAGQQVAVVCRPVGDPAGA